MATLYHQVWINAPKGKVFEGISTADGLGRWWAPHESKQTELGLILSHDPGPAHGVVELKVLDAIDNRRIEWECISSHPPSSPASAWTGTRLLFEISERDNVVAMSGFGKEGDRIAVLDFRHSGWNQNSEYLGFCNFAWGSVLQMLKKWCESQ